MNQRSYFCVSYTTWTILQRIWIIIIIIIIIIILYSSFAPHGA
jgi:hypothetical protein